MCLLYSRLVWRSNQHRRESFSLIWRPESHAAVPMGVADSSASSVKRFLIPVILVEAKSSDPLPTSKASKTSFKTKSEVAARSNTGEA